MPYEHFFYLPFGEVAVHQRANNDGYSNPYQFSSSEFDDATGLILMGARYYDPMFSLWMSADPLSAFRDWLTPYNYVANNPVMFVDPSGLLESSVRTGDKDSWPSILIDPETGNRVEITMINGVLVITVRGPEELSEVVVTAQRVKREERHLSRIDGSQGQPILMIPDEGINNPNVYDGPTTDEVWRKMSESPEGAAQMLNSDLPASVKMELFKHSVVNGNLRQDMGMFLLEVELFIATEMAAAAFIRIIRAFKYSKYIPHRQRVGNILRDNKARINDIELSPTLHVTRRVFTETAREGDLIFYSTRVGDNIFEFGDTFSKSDGVLTINNFDVDGTLVNKLGLKGVKEIITDFGRQQGVHTVIIQGAKRTTGARPGKIPSQLIFKIE